MKKQAVKQVSQEILSSKERLELERLEKIAVVEGLVRLLDGYDHNDSSTGNNQVPFPIVCKMVRAQIEELRAWIVEQQGRGQKCA